MPETVTSLDPQEPIDVDLRNPGWAALLAWLWPGAGHIYQRRYPKGVLFMACILGTYIYGMWLGGGKVVYASWTKEDRRLQYICQVGVGLPALPALVQNYCVMKHGKHFLGIPYMAPPLDQPVRQNTHDKLAEWHEQYGFRYELGTYFTVIAGLLNVLAIYDAFAGPVMIERDEKKKSKPPPEQDDTSGGGKT